MKMMERIWVTGILASLVACGDDEGPSPESLVGTWDATKAEFVNAANQNEKIDLVAEGGAVVLALNEDRTWVMTVSVPGDPDIVQTGDWSADGDELTLSFDPPLVGEMQFDMVLSGNTLTLSGGHTGFDFNDDGTPEDARLTVVLARQ